MIKLSKTSKANYETLHIDLRRIIDRALIYSDIDFGISQGHRPPKEQFELYKKGRKQKGDEWVINDKSKIITYKDGYDKLSKHNYDPSMAFDFFVWVPGKRELVYDENHLIALASMFITIGKDLCNRGEIEYQVRSGMNWDCDGEILTDQSFDDLPHIELI